MKIELGQQLIDVIRRKEKRNRMRTDAVHLLIAALKAYGIKTIVSCPGTQNSKFTYLTQMDSFFECISVVDERSAAYIASGFAVESGAPAVVTCTGATASRNFLSAMTECYYRDIPVIAITFYNTDGTNYSLIPQHLDRSVSPYDAKRLTVNLPGVYHDAAESPKCTTLINAALSSAVYGHHPVHINCPSCIQGTISYQPEEVTKVPIEFPAVKYCFDNFARYGEELAGKKTAIFIGSHKKFASTEEEAISAFAQEWNCPVLCDHTSHYKGRNKVLISRASCMLPKSLLPDVIIDIGGICGEYSAVRLFRNATVWRVTTSELYSARYNIPVVRFFNTSEKAFFEAVKNQNEGTCPYFSDVQHVINCFTIPKLPLSNLLVCSELAKEIPQGTTLDLAILNSLRSMNWMQLDASIDVNCNVGGFGIDGALSSLVGRSLCNKNRLHFAIVGDLAFFYDMNVLGIRHIANNLRILLIQNNRGEEFRLNPMLEENLGDKMDCYIAAAGHYPQGCAKAWAEACGFKYMSARNKEQLTEQMTAFCHEVSDRPVLFEVFTKNEDEQQALSLIQGKNKARL